MTHPHRVSHLETELIAYWPLDEGNPTTVVERVSGLPCPVSFALNRGRYQAPRFPASVPGVRGGALLLDGYSTSVKHPGWGDWLQGGWTISTWVLPRTFDPGLGGRLAACLSQTTRENGAGVEFGVTKHGRWGVQVGFDSGWVTLLSEVTLVPRAQWSHIAAVFDPSRRSLALYLDGDEVKSVTLPVGARILCGSSEVYLGRAAEPSVLVAPFVMNHFDGALSRVRVHRRPLTASEVLSLVVDDLGPRNCKPLAPIHAMMIDRRDYVSDRHRPSFHLTPPGHWMNEPHAPFYYGGRYHLFYQYNPSGPFWHYIHWGHWVTDDLVHWRDLPPALFPDPEVAPDGVWSGSAGTDAEGRPVLYCTAGDNSLAQNQSVAFAHPRFSESLDPELVHWSMKRQSAIRQGDRGLSGQFRDPYVWKLDERWVMLVGSGLEGRGGTALVYTSVDHASWVPQGELFLSDFVAYPWLGTVWELPVLLRLPDAQGNLSEKYVFLISPWGPGAVPDVTYWIGAFDRETLGFVPDHPDPRTIDVGDFHFTGPSGMIDPRSGRALLFTIAQGERTPEIDYDCGWSHSAGLPVHLFLDDRGFLGVEPLPELVALRSQKILDLRDCSSEAAHRALRSVKSDQFEMVLDASIPSDQGYLRIDVRRTPDGVETTGILVDRTRSWFGTDRSRSTLDSSERTRGIQGGVVSLRDSHLSLRIFVDRSLVEVYLNRSRSLTTRTYPSRLDALGLDVEMSSDVQIRSIEIWEMGSIFPHD